MTTATHTVACGRCHSTYRVKDPHALRPGTYSRCRSCEAGFVIVNGVALSNTASQPELTSHSLALRFSFHGDWTSLFGTRFLNIVLTLITGGLYHFWARATVRRYLYRHTSCAGARFDYHGTGHQRFLLFARTLLILGGLSAVVATVLHFMTLSWWSQVMVGGLAALAAFVSCLMYIVASNRHQTDQTTWRDIPFSFQGQTWDFITLSLSGTVLTILSLGAYYPHYHAQRLRYLVSQTSFGNARFRFDGNGWSLTRGFTTTMVCSILTMTLPIALAYLGLPDQADQWPWINTRWAWSGLGLLAVIGLAPLWISFFAAKQQFFWNHTTLAGARFRSTVHARDLRRLYMRNVLLLLVTLGLAWPWVTARTTSYYLAHLTLRGTPDLRQIHPDLHIDITANEGLTDLLDTGLELD